MQFVSVLKPLFWMHYRSWHCRKFVECGEYKSKVISEWEGVSDDFVGAQVLPHRQINEAASCG